MLYVVVFIQAPSLFSVFVVLFGLRVQFVIIIGCVPLVAVLVVRCCVLSESRDILFSKTVASSRRVVVFCLSFCLRVELSL